MDSPFGFEYRFSTRAVYIGRGSNVNRQFSAIVNSYICPRVFNLKALGFSYVTLDLLGYRTGSMNETLQ